MTQNFLNHRELVSALADGQLRDEEFARAMEALARSADARAAWHDYHLVGDVLRSGELAASRGHDAAFVSRLQRRLQREGLVSRPALEANLAADHAHSGGAAGINHLPAASANDAGFRWKLMAAFASLAVLTVLGWHAAEDWRTRSVSPQLAHVTPSPIQPLQQAGTLAEAGQPVMIRDSRLDRLLAAHHQFGGTSALQMPAGFLRNATYEEPTR